MPAQSRLVQVLVGACARLQDAALLQKETEPALRSLLTGALIPLERAPPSWPNYLPKTLPSDTSHQGLDFNYISTCELVWGTWVQMWVYIQKNSKQDLKNIFAHVFTAARWKQPMCPWKCVCACACMCAHACIWGVMGCVAVCAPVCDIMKPLKEGNFATRSTQWNAKAFYEPNK
jgi:hypothetical protein